MAIKIYRPTSAGRRGMSVASFDEVTRSKPERSLLSPITKSGGRNNTAAFLLSAPPPGGGEIHARLARVAGRPAIEKLEKAYRLRPEAEIAAHLGEVLWQAGRTEDARRVWREAAAREPGNKTLDETLARFKITR